MQNVQALSHPTLTETHDPRGLGNVTSADWFAPTGIVVSLAFEAGCGPG